jgi:GNAT superfamily N-acetyltransferase
METGTMKNGPLFKMTAKLANDHVVEFSRLSFDDISEISTFLRSVWSKGYGRMGSPDLSEDYLHWVLGGPDKSRNLLFGGRINNELVAYQSFLFRTMDYCGRELNCYLNTHLAVSTKIDLRARLECLFEMEQQCVLLDERSKYYDPNCDLIFAFFEAGKPLKQTEDRLLRKCFGITRFDYATFNQFMIVPKRLRSYLKENGIEEGCPLLRHMSESDSRELTNLFNEIPECLHFTRIMTQEELKHHFFGHPNHRTSVAETEGKIRGFINYYPIDIIRDGHPSSYIIVEFLVSEDRNLGLMAILLNEALRLAEETGAKGVVLENATYLDTERCQEIGLMPTFRRMTMSLITKNHQVDYFGGFRSDIK